jgi:hypothetical protein
MSKTKRQYWITALAFIVILGLVALESFRAYDRALSKDLERLGNVFGNHPGLALDESLK